MAGNDTRRPKLYLVQGHAGGDAPQRNVARKSAPRVTRGVWGTRWKVQKDLRELPGLAFIRWYLTRFDFSQLEWITVRRSPRPYFPWKDPIPIFGTCVIPEETSSGWFRVNCNVLTGVPYPVRLWDAEEPSSGERQPFFVNDQSEAVVAIIAFEVGLYLRHTGQIVGGDATDVLQAAVEAYRRNIIGDATSGGDRLPGTHAPHAGARWCVLCGKSLSKEGGSSRSFFCSRRCRWTYHNCLRGARLAARRGEMMCEVCSAEFTPKKSDARRCSDACRQKKYRKLLKDRSNPDHQDHQDHRDRHGDHDDDHQDRA